MKTKNTLRRKPSPRQNITLWYVAGGIALAVLVGIGLFFYLNLGPSIESRAAAPFQSNADEASDWIEGGTWLGGNAPVTTDIDYNIEIVEGDFVYLLGDLSYAAKANTLIVNGRLLIDGNLTMGKDSQVEVGVNGELIVTRTFSAGNKSNIDNQGLVAIQEDMKFHNSIHDAYDGGGGLYVGGDVTNDPDAEVEDVPILELTKDGHGEIYDLVTSGVSTLPVTLVYFNANVQGSKVILTWETAAEINNDFFTAERSADGKTFQKLGTVAGAGTTQQRQTYTFTDPFPLNGVSYYRLTQTDFDGKFERFKVVAISRTLDTEARASLTIKSVSPNPFSGSFRVSYEIPESGSVVLQLSDFNGAVLATQTTEATAGYNQYQFEEGEVLNSGVYLLTISSGSSRSKPLRIIKQ